MEISARVRKLMNKFALDPEDVAFADMMHAGWGKTEAAYYAYHLSYFDFAKINFWLKEKQRIRPGINELMSEFSENDNAEKRRVEEMKSEIKSLKDQAKKKRTASEATGKKLTVDDINNVYYDVVHDPMSDSKSRMDAAKGYVAIHKEEFAKESETEDNRTHYYLPLTCSKCGIFREFKKKSKEDKENGSEQG